jgi:hypothetical protein
MSFELLRLMRPEKSHGLPRAEAQHIYEAHRDNLVDRMECRFTTKGVRIPRYSSTEATCVEFFDTDPVVVARAQWCQALARADRARLENRNA